MHDGRLAVDCFVRADAISDPVERRLEALRRLERDGAIDECVVRTWPSEVVLTPLTEQTLVVDRFRTFEEWATQWGVDIDPPFSRETHTSKFTDETREVLRPPALCLAVYVDGRLREVFPHRAEGTCYSAADAIETLEDGLTTGTDDRDGPAVRRGHCPECDVPLTTGQGLYACPDCEWIAVATGDGRFRRYDVPGATEAAPDDAGRSPLRP